MPASDVPRDLQAEYDDLDRVLTALDAAEWDLPTPATGWSVSDQVAHLAFSEELAALAATDATGFATRLAGLLADLDAIDRQQKERTVAMTSADILEWWRSTRRETLDALRAHDVDDRIPWITGDMKLTSFATARLMETWAHGQDVVDAVGASRTPTDRLRHIAHLGVITRGFSFAVRGRQAPDTAVRVALTSPAGEQWAWGPDEATDTITGPAEDFCLVVTQRRHPDDTDLVATGAAAREWIDIAQAFAGPPTDQRAPQQNSRAGRA